MARITRLLLLLALIIPLGCMPQASSAQNNGRLFPETGYIVQGRFLDYWEEQGGLPIFGYPVSPQLWEDGRLVQYFERNRFELHPDKAAPFDVLIGLLGKERLAAQGRDWRTQMTAPADPEPGCLVFPETEHSLCGDFRQYWEQHGGVAVFGFPITEPAPEVSETDGQTYLVQYFERNRFELHPENQEPYNVLLGLLGRWRAEHLLGGRRVAANYRATINGSTTPLRPLEEFVFTIEVPDYSGPGEVLIYDGALRLEGSRSIKFVDGVATVQWRAQGALGAHPAVVRIDGDVAGIASSVYELQAETMITTGNKHFDTLIPRVQEFLSHDVSEYTYKGYDVRGYRSPDSFLLWLRDHVYQALGYRFFDPDMTSLLDYFRREQKPNGAFDDYFAILPDGTPIQGRTDVEADLEFLFVQGVYQAWQATGDDAWLRANIPAMEQGIAYSTGDPVRWNEELQLIRRPYTIDTWDFEYGGPTVSPDDGKVAPRHWIDEKTRFGIMHGDNTGMGYAMQLMSRIYASMGQWNTAADWQARANGLKARLDRVAWNGTFYTHNVLEEPFDIPEIDESQQLSLSNAYALNRDVLSLDQARAIIGEYYRRRAAAPTSLQSEWYSIDPPFPAESFGTRPGWGNVPGEYVNGGLMPLVGGELARGAFHWGEELYGFDILRRYEQLITIQNGTYLWYYPAGNPGISGPDTLATDGWGSSAMLAALIEGAAGVVDNYKLYQDVTIAPRWAMAPEVQQAAVSVRYAASLGYVAYQWERQERGLVLTLTGSGERAHIRLLLPAEAPNTLTVLVNGVPSSATITWVGSSRYVDLKLTTVTATVAVSW